MNKILSVLVVLLFFGCKESTKKVVTKEEKKNLIQDEVGHVIKPLEKVFEAHGGINLWKNHRTITFTLPKSDNPEIHTIDLRTRKEKIKTNNWTTGFNGQDIWLLDENDSYKGDPIFYHNLMFYFYSMPFVLGDKGINYAEIENLEFEGKSYPGIAISFDDGIGVSSKDEYRLYYNPKTHQMAWLGYTVSYRSGEKSDNFNWISYNDWNEISGLLLPNSITWYANENGMITEPRKTVFFEDVKISKEVNSSEYYSMPENAKVVKRTK
ncbi:hypothetical protein GH721_00895 [Kriegella sp. EG-1]|nr:hypothetical protein [Flavobacteriaceae bacterium EG-1]